MLPRGRHWLCDLKRRTRSMLRRSKVSKLKWLRGLMGEMFPILLYRVIQCQCHTFPLNFQIWFAIVMWFNCVTLAADDTQQCAQEMKVSTSDIALLSHQFPCSHFVSSLFCDSSQKWIWRQEKKTQTFITFIIHTLVSTHLQGMRKKLDPNGLIYDNFSKFSKWTHPGFASEGLGASTAPSSSLRQRAWIQKKKIYNLH